MSSKVGVVIEIEHSDLAEIIRLSDESRSIGHKSRILQFGRADRNNTAQLPAELRFRKEAIVYG